MKKPTKLEKLKVVNDLQARAYGGISPVHSNEYLKCALYLMADATWHLYRAATDSGAPPDVLSFRSPTAQLWSCWEEFDRRMPLEIARKQHWNIFGFAAPASMPKHELTVLIYTYRCKHAVDHRSGVAVEGGGRDALARSSKLVGRQYRLLEPPEHVLIADLEGGRMGIFNGLTEKWACGKQGLVCYQVIAEACLSTTAGYVTEGELRVIVEKRASDITPKIESAWRFLQFYRPILVREGLISYSE